MGLTFVEGIVHGAKGAGRQTATVRFLVDSGATYTLLPISVWQKLKLKPDDSMDFVLADGTTVTRKLSECRITIGKKTRHSTVILGETGDEPLLGAVTLEELGVVLNPFKRTLEPMRMMLASSFPAGRSLWRE